MPFPWNENRAIAIRAEIKIIVFLDISFSAGIRIVPSTALNILIAVVRIPSPALLEVVLRKFCAIKTVEEALKRR